jgi:flagellar protein FlbT
VLILQNKASVLREKDILQPEDANTPAKRIYFPVMMMYLDETAAGKVYDEFALRLSEFMGASRNPEVLADCVAASSGFFPAAFCSSAFAFISASSAVS